MGLLAVSMLVLLSSCIGQFGAPPAKKKAPAHKEDIPFIQCQVCHKIVDIMRAKVESLKAANTKLDEAEIIDVLEQLCNPDAEAGEWITMLDLVEDGTRLNVVDTKQIGECTWECQTVARTCNNILEDVDLSDFSQLLYQGDQSKAHLLNWLCHDSTDVCKKTTPPLPEGRSVGPKHTPMSEGEISAQKVLRSMKAAGLSGTMMDREQMRAELEEAKASGLLNDEAEAGTPDLEVPTSDPAINKDQQEHQQEHQQSRWPKAFGSVKNAFKQASGRLVSSFSAWTSGSQPDSKADRAEL